MIALLFITVSCGFRSDPVYYTSNTKYHMVKSGDTLDAIGKKYNLSVENLKLFNNLKSDTIYPGQKLYLTPKLRQKREYVTVRPIPASGYHVVRSQEKITTIAKMYDLSILELINLNQLKSFDLTVGQKLYLQSKSSSNVYHEPEQQIPAQETPVQETEEDEISKDPVTKEKNIPARKNFSSRPVLPLKGNISSEFGLRNGKPHKGIDVVAEIGTPILAALDGEVAYVGNQRGYGNVIILEHDNFIMTVYAHNEANLVREGDRVAGGQPIATVGNSGSTTGPHLHFEYRVKGVARDPRELLPDF